MLDTLSQFSNKIHIRRYYADFINSMDKSTIKSTIAMEAYKMITDILHTDNRFDDLPSRDRKKQRQTILKKKVNAYFARAKLKYSQVTHNSTIGKVLAYSIN